MKHHLIVAVILTLLLNIHPVDAQDATITGQQILNNDSAITKNDSVDPFSKRITYNSGKKRLYKIIEDISTLGGLIINCGQNRSDWQTRDIPTVVCVKNMPIGKLMEAIANATHTRIIHEKHPDDTSTSYRYIRSFSDDSISGDVQKKHEVMLEKTKWQLDALVAYGKSAEITTVPGLHRKTWLIARLIEQAGSKGVSDLLNGDTLVFRGNDTDYESIIDELYRYEHDNRHSKSIDAAPQISADDIQAAVLKIKIKNDESSGDICIETNLSPLVFGPIIDEAKSNLNEIDLLKYNKINIRTYPPDTIMENEDSINDSEMVPILRLSKQATWDLPFMRKKIDITLPSIIKAPIFSDFITAIASASGCNIVTEDFSSHKTAEYQDIPGLLQLCKKNTTLTEALDSICTEGNKGYTGYTYFGNEKDELIIGWANDRSNIHSWKYYHRNMLSENYLEYLTSRLNGDGLGFDDAIHCVNLPKDSFDEWILRSRDLAQLTGIRPSDEAIWKLYDSLSKEDKELAKSTNGLPLSKYDPNWISSFFDYYKYQEHLKGELPIPLNNNKQDNEKSPANIHNGPDSKAQIFSNPEIISTMVIHLTRKPASTCFVPGKGFTDIPDGLHLYKIEMEINYKVDDKANILILPGPPTAFPVISFTKDKGRHGYRVTEP